MKKILLTILVLLFFVAPTFAIDCKSADECVVIGEKLIIQKEYQTAVECFDTALSMDEDTYMAYAFRAKSYYYIGNYDFAIEDATKSIELHPNSIAYGVRGGAKLACGDTEGAIEDTTKALEINPEYMECYVIRARAEANAEQFVEALKDANKAISLKDDYAKSYEVLGYAQIGIKDVPSAKDSFEKAKKLFKTNKDRKNYRLMKKKVKECKRLLK